MGNSFLTKRGQRPVRTPLDQCRSRFTVGTHVSNRNLNGDYTEDFTILPDPIFFENNGHVFVIVKEVVRTVYRCGKYAIVSHRNFA